MTDGLDANEWQRAGALFHVLVALDPAERSARLSSMSTDPALRSAVEALLAGDAVADERLPQPGFGVLENWSAVDPLQLVGRAVSHFRVGESLASGGMGVVYRAEDLQLRRSVALKFLLPQYQLTDSSKERFVREARAAGSLDHPNLCPVYEIGESSAGLYLAMPLYAGETLKDRLARTGSVPADEALAIASQIAAGLHHAHAAGILHRDIKPGNVMLLPDGMAKILDFGLAKVRAESTASAGVLGTVSYMSPEQVRGDAVDGRADLWALGVILYEMLCGVRPFAAEHERAILHKIENARPRPMSEWSPSVAPQVEALVLALLEKKPGARYLRASEVVDAITAIQSGARSVRRPRRRRARRFTVAAGAGLVALIATAYVGLGPGRSLLHGGAIVAREPLVVADFDVAGSDSALGPILAERFERDLQGSKVVGVMKRGRVAAVLERMRRSPGTRLTPAIAREVAQREGARAFVRGDVEPLGSGYLLSVQLVAAGTGDELASFHAPVPRPESDLLPALDSLGISLRRALGDSLRDVPAGSPLRPLTTSSLEALRLFDATFPRGRPAAKRTLAEVLARLRRIVALDSTFAYAWFMTANSLSLRYRTNTRDSAFMMMYRFRDRLTPFEGAQATALYWAQVGLDRSQSFAAYESLLAAGDSSEWKAVLNFSICLDDAREFGRSETLLRRYGNAIALNSRSANRPQSASAYTRLYLVDAAIGQGKLAVADSLLAREEGDRPRSETLLRARLHVALATLQLDSAEAFATRRLRLFTPGASGADTLAAIARTRGRLSDAHRFEAAADSLDASALRTVQFVPVFDRPLSRAAEDLWLRGAPSHAVARLDDVFAAHAVRSLNQIQNRMDAVRGAALYAAAGRPDRARTILAGVMATSDSIERRAVHSSRLTVLGEIALAEGRPRDAMTLFHESDLAADGLPATRCAVCVFPRLARAAERAGWADSARFYWERYVTTASLDRPATDQWFLAMAYRRLAESYALAGDAPKAGEYRAKLEKLWVNADPAVPRQN